MLVLWLLVAQQPEILLQNGHNAGVLAVAFSADGKRLATGSYDHDIKIWDASSGQLLSLLSGLTQPVSRLSFSPDGERLLSAGYEDEHALWNLRTGKIEKRPHKDYGMLAFGHDGRARGLRFKDKQIDIVDLSTDAVIASITDPTLSSWAALSPNGNVLATTQDLKTTLWDVATGKQIRTIYASGVMAFSADSSQIAITIADRKYARVKIARTDGSSAEAITPDRKGEVKSIAFSADGSRVAVGWGFGLITVMDKNGAVLAEWKPGSTSGMTGDIYSLAFSQTQLAIGHGDTSVFLADHKSGEVLHTLRTHSTAIHSLAFAPDGRRLYASSKGGFLRAWDARSGNLEQGWSLGRLESGIAVSADNSLVAYGLSGKWVIADARTGEVKKEYATDRVAWGMAFSADGSTLAVAAGEELQTISVQTGARLKTFRVGSARDLQRVYLSADGKRIATTTGDTFAGAAVLVFDLASGKQLSKTLVGKNGLLNAFLSEDFKTVAVSNDAGVRLYDVATKKEIAALKGTESFAQPITFSHDGAFVLTGSRGGLVSVWEVATGAPRGTLSSQHDMIRGIAFSPDGKHVAVGGDDTMVRLYDWEKRAELVSLIGLDAQDFVSVTPDNYYRASRGALRLVSFRVGEKLFPFEQFDLRFNRPDILLQRLGRASRDEIELYKHAYVRRLQRMRFTEEMLGGDFHLPEVSIASVNQGAGGVDLALKATDSKYKLDRLNVFVNDVPIYGVNGLDLRTQAPPGKVSVPLSDGRNKIQVSVLNEKGVESLRETTIAQHKGSKPKLWVVAVGVSAYKDPEYALRYAAKDAADIATAFEAQRDKFSGVEVVRLLDAEATREKIAAARATLMRSSVDDEAVVFVAGHGLLDDQLDYYFATADVDFAQPAGRGMTYDAIEALLDGIPARKKALLMDTCHSGELDKTTTALAPGVVVAKEFRGLKRVKRVGGDVLEGLFADLRRGSGATVISSASGVEFALESSQLKNGVFTFALLQALSKPAKISQVRDEIAEKVMALTAGQQHPTARRENLESDFLILPY